LPASLACVVLSLRNQPGLVDAVRSLVTQDPRPEVVVVNSGGGDARASLARAGLDVPVVEHPERLFAGGARNRGIEATEARYVAFLAADSVAEPGWVAGRLRRHEAGADVVACVLTSPPGASRSATAAHLLLNHRRMPDTPVHERLNYGLSYDRELFRRFGSFREDMRAGEDSEFNSRLGDSVTTVYAADVRTQHEAPSDVAGLLRDQYARGRRRARIDQHHRGRQMLRHAKVNVRDAMRQARRTEDPGERAQLVRAWPLLVPGALAYLAGGVATVTLGPR
jgi:glycosyltransferase involved in cell wall biosynthesis